MVRLISRFLCLFTLGAAAAEEGGGGSCNDENNPSMECSKGGDWGVNVPLLGDTLDANPAMLPTEHTPFGLEAMGSHRGPPHGKPKFGLSTVQGFDGLGFGLGTWRPGNYGSPDAGIHFRDTSANPAYSSYEQADKGGIGLRLGTTFVVPSIIFPSFIRYSVGGSVGLGAVKGDMAPQVGVLVRIFHLGIGYSENFTKLANDLPRLRVSVGSVGLYFRRTYLSYSYTRVQSSLNRTHSKAVGILFPCDDWAIYGGWKWQDDRQGGRDDWFRGGLLWSLAPRVRLGYDYGYYRFAHSAILQIFLGSVGK